MIEHIKNLLSTVIPDYTIDVQEPVDNFFCDYQIIVHLHGDEKLLEIEELDNEKMIFNVFERKIKTTLKKYIDVDCSIVYSWTVDTKLPSIKIN